MTREQQRFSPAILAAWPRKTLKITEALPLLYLRGLSSRDFMPALGQFPGSAAGLSAAVITRLTEQWKGRHRLPRVRDGGVDLGGPAISRIARDYGYTLDELRKL